MSGFFGDEPTCARCDYPRRLHGLLGVEHEYTPKPEEKNGSGAAATAPEPENNPNHEEGASSMSKTTDRTPGGMSLPEGVTETVMIAAFAKIGTQIGASDEFPVRVSIDELERFAQWAGESFEDLLQNARDAVGASNTAWVPCTECRRAADEDGFTDPDPTHAVWSDGRVSLAPPMSAGNPTGSIHAGRADTTIEADELIETAGYTRTGCWDVVTAGDGSDYRIAPIQAVTR